MLFMLKLKIKGTDGSVGVEVEIYDGLLSWKFNLYHLNA